MARPLILANGNIFVGLNESGFVSDFFFPYVGVENHVRGEAHRIGVWYQDSLSWLDESSWSKELDLNEDTFVGTSTYKHSSGKLEIIITNVVYNEKNIFLRKVDVINHSEETLHIKIFFHQVFSIYETLQGDTAYYDPVKNSLIHYEGRRVFMIYGEVSEVPFNEYSVGLYGIEGKDGTFKDAEDGVLSKNPIEHGRVDSTLALPFVIHPHDTKTGYTWITVGETKSQVYDLHEYIKYKGPDHIINSTARFWKAWLHRQDNFTCDLSDKRQIELFKKSLFYIRGHIDNRGAILASGDSEMLHHGRDTYSYMWPRDGAMTVRALLLVGEYNVSKHFFKFCNDVLEEDGYLMHKYKSDKSLGSSWHPFVKDDKPILPIQEDETALVLITLWEYYEKTKDIEFIDLHYHPVIKKMGDFLTSYMDAETGLPLPSYDLWEEKRGVSTFTSSTVYAGLIAAANFAKLFEKSNRENHLRETAERLRKAIIEHLYDKDLKMFVKLLNKENGIVVYDKTIDMSSIYGVYTFGILPVDDPLVQESINTIEEKLRLNKGIDGVPRYVGDRYYLQTEEAANPWFITTLWLAQYYALSATKADELDRVNYWMKWAVTHTPRSSVLSEQLHPFSGIQLGATPLTWSHSEYVRTVILYHQALEKFGLCNRELK